ncbi:CPK3 [Symbiodinium natans]|uniref:CPK3 protein n=1 Tax=Symbiodinium natans TaxID=878477 RepID=A0A812V393_9DINO|nr:CPK3 [Symbiodinium natans]
MPEYCDGTAFDTQWPDVSASQLVVRCLVLAYWCPACHSNHEGILECGDPAGPWVRFDAISSSILEARQREVGNDFPCIPGAIFCSLDLLAMTTKVLVDRREVELSLQRRTAGAGARERAGDNRSRNHRAFVWEWCASASGHGSWCAYDAERSSSLEKAWNQRAPRVSFSMNGVNYNVDYELMVQVLTSWNGPDLIANHAAFNNKAQHAMCTAMAVRCGALLWPPKAPSLAELCPGRSDAAVPPALALALRRGLPDILLYRSFLLLARAKGTVDKEAERAYTPLLVKLRNMGFLVHDSLLLPADVAGQRRLLLLVQPPEPLKIVQLAKVLRSLDSPSLSVTLQPQVPTAQLSIKDEAARRLCVDHWHQACLDCLRYFPRFFQPRTRMIVLPPSTSQEVDDICCHLLLHGFGVLSVVHPSSEKAPKVDACIMVRGMGMLPVCGTLQRSY